MNNRQPARRQPAPQQLAQKQDMLNNLLAKTKADFTAQNLDFASESLFAMQALSQNDYAVSIVQKNPESLIMAMRNVAAIGLTLNPAEKMAYLVPRNGKIILDISYRGMLDVAIRSGAIQWAKPELVFSNDHFEYYGPDKEPAFRCDPFLQPGENGRGDLRGGFVVYKLPNGDKQFMTMRLDEILQARDSSQSWLSYKDGKTKSCIWVDWWEQMCLKTLIKRAWKLWVGTGQVRQMALVETILNNDNGEGMANLSQEDMDKLTTFAQEVFYRATESQQPYETVKEYIVGKFQREPAKAEYIMQVIDHLMTQAA